MKIEHIYTVPTTHSSKFIIDDRYAVYISPFCSPQQIVIDTITDTDITDTIKGMELLIVARKGRYYDQ